MSPTPVKKKNKQTDKKMYATYINLCSLHIIFPPRSLSSQQPFCQLSPHTSPAAALSIPSLFFQPVKSHPISVNITHITSILSHQTSHILISHALLLHPLPCCYLYSFHQFQIHTQNDSTAGAQFSKPPFSRQLFLANSRTP